MSDRLAGSSWTNPIWYRGYRIYLSWFPGQFDYAHDDYDGAEDSNDNRRGVCNSFEECKAEIDELEGN